LSCPNLLKRYYETGERVRSRNWPTDNGESAAVELPSSSSRIVPVGRLTLQMLCPARKVDVSKWAQSARDMSLFQIGCMRTTPPASDGSRLKSSRQLRCCRIAGTGGPADSYPPYPPVHPPRIDEWGVPAIAAMPPRRLPAHSIPWAAPPDDALPGDLLPGIARKFNHRASVSGDCWSSENDVCRRSPDLAWEKFQLPVSPAGEPGVGRC